MPRPGRFDFQECPNSSRSTVRITCIISVIHGWMALMAAMACYPANCEGALPPRRPLVPSSPRCLAYKFDDLDTRIGISASSHPCFLGCPTISNVEIGRLGSRRRPSKPSICVFSHLATTTTCTMKELANHARNGTMGCAEAPQSLLHHLSVAVITRPRIFSVFVNCCRTS
jgi:hypothetical protein